MNIIFEYPCIYFAVVLHKIALCAISPNYSIDIILTQTVSIIAK